MDDIDLFLNNNTTEERYELLTNTYSQLVAHGYLNHELNIEGYVNRQGTMDNNNIVLLIENELLNACHELTLKYYIVCRRDNNLKPYLDLFEMLHYLNNTIESSTIIHFLNDELDAREQLLEWVEVLRNDLYTNISDLVLDVMDKLIDNISQTHELKMDIENTEPDILFDKKIQYLKALREVVVRDTLAVILIRKKLLTKTYTIDNIVTKYNKYVYASDTDIQDTAINIISLAMMSSNEIGSINYDARTIASKLYDDVKRVNLIINYIDETLNQAGTLCKIMNTI